MEATRSVRRLLPEIPTTFGKVEATGNVTRLLLEIPTLFGNEDATRNATVLLLAIPTTVGNKDSTRYATIRLLKINNRISKGGHNEKGYKFIPRVSKQSMHVKYKVPHNHGSRCKYQHISRIRWNKQNFILPSWVL